MSRTYQGGIITKTPITPSGPYQCGAASGVWTIDQMVGWQKAGLWPTAGNIGVGTFAIFALGNVSGTSTTRNKYTFSSCLNGTATAASAASYSGSAAGNSTVGIFALGYTSGYSTTRDKYTYSGCVVSSGAAARVASDDGSAAGNATVGIFAIGNSTTTRDKYTYSGDTNGTATAASAASSYGSAASNGTTGVNV